MSAGPAHPPTNEGSHPRMLDAARKRLPNPDDAEDVVQEAYILLLEGRSNHPYQAVRRAAKEWRSRLYGRARDGSKTRQFWHIDGEADADGLLNGVMRLPEPPSPADLQARTMRAIKGRCQAPPDSPTPHPPPAPHRGASASRAPASCWPAQSPGCAPRASSPPRLASPQ